MGIGGKKEREETSNPQVYRKLKRQDWRCPLCPANKNENANRKPKHGKGKPKYKDHR